MVATYQDDTDTQTPDSSSFKVDPLSLYPSAADQGKQLEQAAGGAQALVDKTKDYVSGTAPPTFAPTPLGPALGGALASNPVTGSGNGAPNQPQNPAWQAPTETPGVTQPGTPLGTLQAERYNPNDPTAGNVAPDAAQKLGGAAATALPMVAFGPAASAASMGAQGATEAAGAPKIVQDIAGLAPYMAGGIPANGLLKTGAETIGAGAGQYAGNQVDKALNLPDIPIVSGPGGFVGMMAGGMAGGAGAEAASGAVDRMGNAAVPDFTPRAPAWGQADEAHMQRTLVGVGGGDFSPREMFDLAAHQRVEAERVAAEQPQSDLEAALAASLRGERPENPMGKMTRGEAADKGLLPGGDNYPPASSPAVPQLTPQQVRDLVNMGHPPGVEPEMPRNATWLQAPQQDATARAVQMAEDARFNRGAGASPDIAAQRAPGAGGEPLAPNQVGGVVEGGAVGPEEAANSPPVAAPTSSGAPSSAPTTPLDDAAIRDIAKQTGLGLGNLRGGDPQAILEGELQRQLNAKEMYASGRGMSGSDAANKSSAYAASMRANAYQKALDAYFPDSELATKAPTSVDLTPSSLDEMAAKGRDSTPSPAPEGRYNEFGDWVTPDQEATGKYPASLTDKATGERPPEPTDAEVQANLAKPKEGFAPPTGSTAPALTPDEAAAKVGAGGPNFGAQKALSTGDPSAMPAGAEVTPPGGGSGSPPHTPGELPPAGGDVPRSGPVSTAMDAAKQLFREVRDATLLPNAAKVMDHIPLFRQGGTSLFADPVGSLEGVKAAAKAFVSEHGAQEIRDTQAALADTHPKAANGWEAPSPNDAGLRIAQSGKVTSTAREGEMEWVGSGNTLASKLAENTPGVKNTERAYPAEMNQVRLHSYQVAAQAMADSGERNLQAYKNLANALNIRTGYGPLGNGPIPTVFSMRALSARFMQPLQLVTEFGNPFKPGAYREVVKTNLANAALGGAGLAIAQLAGANIVNSKDGLPVAVWKSAQGATQQWDPWAGQNAVAKLFMRSVQAVQKGGSYNDVIGRLTDLGVNFGRSELNPFNSQLADAVTGQDWKGDKVEGNGVLGRAANLMTDPKQIENTFAPFWAESFYDGLRDFGVSGGLRALPSLGGGSVNTYEGSPGAGAKSARAEALSSGKVDLPPEVLKGLPKDGSGLTPRVREAVDRAAGLTKEAPTQALTDPRERALQVASEIKDAKLTSLQDDVFNGVKDPITAKTEYNAIRAEALQRQKDAPAYANSGSGGDVQKSDAQKLLDGYYSISKNVPAGADGKPNFDGIRQAQAQYMEAMKKDHPDQAQVVAYELNHGSEQRHEFEKAHDAAQPLVDHYLNEAPADRRAELMQHPQDDAKLVILGYQRAPSSIEAAHLLDKMAPNLKLAPATR